MNNPSIGYWKPIIYDSPTPWQIAGNLIEVTCYFGKSMVHIDSSGKPYECSTDEANIVLGVILKVAAFAATFFTGGIFLLVLLAAKAFYRNQNTIKIPAQIISLEEKNLSELKKLGKQLCQHRNIQENERLKLKRDNKKYLISLNSTQDIRVQEIVKKLGRGGFGAVYQLKDLETRKSTALKIAKPSNEYKDSDEALAIAEHDLQREFDNLTLLNKQGKQIGIQSGPLTPILKIINNKSVTKLGFEGKVYDRSLDKLDVHTLELKTRFHIIYQVVQGAKCFRRNGLVHSDLKPANILYREIGKGSFVVDVSDFGSAWSKYNAVENLTYTPAYASMRDIKNVASSITTTGRHWSGKKQDIYSLGMTLFELLTGRMLFEDQLGSLEKELREAGLTDKKYNEFIAIMQRMLSKQKGIIIDGLTELIGGKTGRPTINEVVKVIEKVM